MDRWATNPRSAGRTDKRRAPESDTEETDVAFTELDDRPVNSPPDEPLVISLRVENCVIKRVFVDSGSAASVLSTTAFERMGYDRARIRPPMTQITAGPEGVTGLSDSMQLLTTIGDEEEKSSALIT
ncbi:hypothetical protein U1Q18_031349, partial [Sarracenia purpurea var. burkii]